jgi:glycerol uptake facilitator-like aquaporin
MSGLARRTTAEALGTAFLVMAVVGSGIMGERLASGNVAMALLANTLATGAALGALISCFGPISGAHFNPALSLAATARGGLTLREAAAYLAAQFGGALLGVVLAHAMFGEPLLSWSQHARGGPAQLLSEFIATFGLLTVISSTARYRPSAAPLAVAAYIMGAYWFTASTSFANPALTVARAASDTFSGIRPVDVPGFLLAQAAGAAAASALCGWLLGRARPQSDVLVPHPGSRKEAS